MSILISEEVEALWRKHCHAIGPIALQDLAFARAVEATVRATARAQMNEECAVMASRFLGGDSCADAIRALLGKEAT